MSIPALSQAASGAARDQSRRLSSASLNPSWHASDAVKDVLRTLLKEDLRAGDFLSSGFDQRQALASAREFLRNARGDAAASEDVEDIKEFRRKVNEGVASVKISSRHIGSTEEDSRLSNELGRLVDVTRDEDAESTFYSSMKNMALSSALLSHFTHMQQPLRVLARRDQTYREHTKAVDALVRSLSSGSTDANSLAEQMYHVSCQFSGFILPIWLT
ncbi:hypothetical protein K488DRAFT_85048 [Vararia minispora EC-137]|uniref:Uncharacterized protein n=1 Tax=Vararia minispora EC-137 TaxID=1314806 RepID=A0ACB8QNM8_9AGAM|nr:hypothetical protein K488DRAFT_85048 [Vararia minispora EC-137]